MRKLYFMLCIAFITVGCGVQRQVVSGTSENPESSVYKRSDIVNAVKNGTFKLELTEQIDFRGKLKNAFDSYISVDGEHIFLNLSPRIDNYQQMSVLTTEYNDCSIEDLTIRKKRMRFTVLGNIDPGTNSPLYRTKIFLYISASTDSDICFVDISFGRGGSPYYRFRGRIIPFVY